MDSISLNLDINRMKSERERLCREISELEKKKDVVLNEISDQRSGKTIVYNEASILDNLRNLLQEQVSAISEIREKNFANFSESHEKQRAALDSMSALIEENKKIVQSFEISKEHVEELKEQQTKLSLDIKNKRRELGEVTNAIEKKRQEIEAERIRNEGILQKIQKESADLLAEKETIFQLRRDLELFEARLLNLKKSIKGAEQQQ